MRRRRKERERRSLRMLIQRSEFDEASGDYSNTLSLKSIRARAARPSLVLVQYTSFSVTLIFPSIYRTDVHTFRVVHDAGKYSRSPSCVCPPTIHSFPVRASRLSYANALQL